MAETSPPTRPIPCSLASPRGAASYVGMFDIISRFELEYELTELLLDTAPTLTSSELRHLRERLVVFSRQHGWVHG